MMKKILNVVSLLLLLILTAGASYYMYEVQKNEKALEAQISNANSELVIANNRVAELQRVAKSRADEVEMEFANIALATSSTGASIVGYPISLSQGNWTAVMQAYTVEIPAKPSISFTNSGSILASPVAQKPVTQERLKLILSKWMSGVLVESYEFEYPEGADIKDILEYMDK